MSSCGSPCALVGHAHRVDEQLGRRRLRVALEVRVLAGEHRVGPVEQLLAVLLRHADQVRDGLQRQLGGQLLDEVARAPRGRLLDDPVGPLGHDVLERADRPGREAAGDDVAGAGVLGRVLVEQDHPLQLDVLALDLAAVADDRAVLGRRPVLAVLGDRRDVRVLGHRPVAGAGLRGDAGARLGRLLHPVHRRGLAERGELLVRDASQLRSGSVKSKPSGRMSVVTQCSAPCRRYQRYATCRSLTPLIQPWRSRRGSPSLADVRRVVGEGAEDQVDLQAGQVGADAVVRAVAAEGQVRVGVAGDVEAERVVEDVLVEVGARVEEADALALVDRHAADLDVVEGGALEDGDRRGPADDLVGRGRRAARACRAPTGRGSGRTRACRGRSRCGWSRCRRRPAGS